MHVFLRADGYTSASEAFAKLRSNEHGQKTYSLQLWAKAHTKGTTSRIMLVLATDKVDDTAVPAGRMALELALTTADLCVISWNKAYSLHPRSTFLVKEAYLLSRIVPELSESLQSLSTDGIRVKGLHWSAQHDDSNVPQALTRYRRIGDKFTWTLDLDTTGITPSSCIPTKVLESNTYRLALPFGLGCIPVHHYTMMTSSIVHPVLEYAYLHADYHHREDRKYVSPAYGRQISGLKERLDDALMLEMTNMKEEDRPREYDDVVVRGTYRGHVDWDKVEIVKGETWKYWDGDVLEWLEQAWKRQEEVDDGKSRMG
jgi:hypothetical protein